MSDCEDDPFECDDEVDDDPFACDDEAEDDPFAQDDDVMEEEDPFADDADPFADGGEEYGDDEGEKEEEDNIGEMLDKYCKVRGGLSEAIRRKIDDVKERFDVPSRMALAYLYVMFQRISPLESLLDSTVKRENTKYITKSSKR